MQAIQKRNLFNFIGDSLYSPDNANFWLQKINPTWSVSQALGKIIKKKILAKDTVGLVVKCNHLMNYGVAGQHHPVIVEIAGRRYERTYSLTHLDPHHVQINVKKVAGGLISSWLCDTAKVGDVVEFGKPYGEMILGNNPQKIIMIAGGSGITPMFSMLYGMAQTSKLTFIETTLLYWAKTQEEFAFTQEFNQWQNDFQNFNVHYFCTQESPFDKRINETQLNLFKQIEKHDVFICGASGFVNSAKAIFKNAKSVRTEAFSMQSVIADDNDVGNVEILLTKSNKTLNIAKGQPILQALENANIHPEHGCRMGICNKCACHKTTGQTKNLNDGSINHEPNQEVRICVNSAQSDLVLDL